MIVCFSLHNRFVGAAVFGLTTLCFLWLLTTVVEDFVIGTLSDNRYKIEQNILRAGIQTYPDSSRLFVRLAQSQSQSIDGNLAQAESYADAAVQRSPVNYNNRLLLASIKDERGDQTGAERVLRETLTLAPHYSEVDWRIANLLVREGKIDESVNYFQTVARLNPALIDQILDLLWNITGRTNLAVLNKIADNNPRAQLALTRFLVKENRIAEAAELLTTMARQTALDSWEVPQIIYTLIGKNYPRLAHELWLRFMATDNEPATGNLIWNGNFEKSGVKNFEHFDWHLSHSDFARISFDDRETHSGNNALLIDFLGRDTTVLNTEVKQQIAVSAGTAYRLELFVRTDDFHSPEGPRVVVSDFSGKWSAASPPIVAGSADWHRVSFDFVSPRIAFGDGVSLLISIKRQPKFSYDDPTRGRIWFDDFILSEAHSK